MELRNQTRRQVDGISDYEYGDSDDDLYVGFVTQSSRNFSSIYNNTDTSAMANKSLLESVEHSDNYICIEIAQIVLQPSDIQLSTQKLQDIVKPNLGLVFRKPSQICIVMVDENKEIAFDLDQVAKFRFSDVTGQKEILLDMKKGFKKEFYEFPLKFLDVRLQTPVDPSRGKLDDATTIIFKICKDVDNSLIVKLINHIKQWKSTNVKPSPQYSIKNSQHSNDNTVNQEVKNKGSLIKPARDDLCEKQTIRSNTRITALDNDGNDESQVHNNNHVNDGITDWINESKEKHWTNDNINQVANSTITVQPEKRNVLKTSKNSNSDSELHITCIFITKKYALLISFDTYLKQLTALIEQRYNVKISMDRLYYRNHAREKISLIDEEDWDVAKKEAMNAETFRINLIIE
ncbi:883_t:CDS:2 [Cetraspora pellucida]|uniref:883_t:CDS:1 n=1 Tax=Cetraspora pellucida TaxID=1433469 RepID=A0ACA9KQX0_9GLOM|nr:883_t:CDS:2 [Cetraspora pellucida]